MSTITLSLPTSIDELRELLATVENALDDAYDAQPILPTWGNTGDLTSSECTVPGCTVCEPPVLGPFDPFAVTPEAQSPRFSIRRDGASLGFESGVDEVQALTAFLAKNPHVSESGEWDVVNVSATEIAV